MSYVEPIIKKSLERADFTSLYIDLCNSYSNFDNGKNIKKADIKSFLDKEGLQYKIAGSENCFYRDYDFEKFKLRFLVGYKHGFIDALYNFWNDDFSIRVLGGFKTYCEMTDPDFDQKVKYRFPISCSESMATEIILKVLELHERFLTEFKENYKNYLQQSL